MTGRHGTDGKVPAPVEASCHQLLGLAFARELTRTLTAKQGFVDGLMEDTYRGGGAFRVDR